MADQFLSEIRIFPFNFAPVGWALCQGQILPISQNTALFSLIGTIYGGNGTSNFALPNLQGRIPLKSGQGPGLSLYDLGEEGGAETVTLTTNQMAMHTHAFMANSSKGTGQACAGSQISEGLGGSKTQVNAANLFSNQLAKATTMLSPGALSTAGSGFAHTNLMPYLTLSYCIALTGIYPPRS